LLDSDSILIYCYFLINQEVPFSSIHIHEVQVD